MAEKTPAKDQDYSLMVESIKGVNKAVDKLSVKLDGVTNIAMSMSNEIARLDERVTFALDQQKNHANDMTNIKERVSKLESYDVADNKSKELMSKVMLVVLSVILTGILMMMFAPA